MTRSIQQAAPERSRDDFDRRLLTEDIFTRLELVRSLLESGAISPKIFKKDEACALSMLISKHWVRYTLTASTPSDSSSTEELSGAFLLKRQALAIDVTAQGLEAGGYVFGYDQRSLTTTFRTTGLE